MRIYAPERTDSVVSVTPTRSVYKRRAEINRLVFREVELRPDNFELDAEALLDSVDNSTRLIFLFVRPTTRPATCWTANQ